MKDMLDFKLLLFETMGKTSDTHNNYMPLLNKYILMWAICNSDCNVDRYFTNFSHISEF